MIAAGIVGSTGYGGQELLRLLRGHPEVNIVGLASTSQGGRRLGAVLPQFAGTEAADEVLVEEPEALFARADTIFLAVPHGGSLELAGAALEAGCRVIDLSGGFRLGDDALYRQWYGFDHPVPALLERAVYGLSEWYPDEVAAARLVANPGCYPTAALLALLPAAAAAMVAPESVVVDAVSGLSGAGRTPSAATHFSHRNESAAAYKVAGHRHTPEIEQVLADAAGAASGSGAAVTFTPRVVPMARGILSTVYGRLQPGWNGSPAGEAVRERYLETYDGAPFLQVLPAGTQPETKWVSGTNRCFVAVTVDERAGRLVATSVIDNLGKGAAGQAVQNMNIMHGIEETTGLTMTGMYP